MTTTGSMATTLGAHNPLRYRGYVYDRELGLYYPQSRYYDPDLCRFLNADIFVSTGQGELGNNMFAYCLNNPANYVDPSGSCGLCLTNRSSDQFSYIFLCDCGGGGAGGGTGIIVLPVSGDLAKETAALIIASVATLEATTRRGTQHVYILTDPNADHIVKYVGRTNNPARRMKEHENDWRHPERAKYAMTVIASGLTLRQAMLVEQLLISAFTLGYLENARNEIAAGKIDKYWQYVDAAKEIFVGASEEGIMALLGG